MTNRITVAFRLAAFCAIGGLVHAQGRGGADWTTGGFDAQRTAWVRNDPRISVETMLKPGEFGPFKFLWKLKLEHDPKAAPALTEPVLLDRIVGFRGFKSIAYVATASETVHAVDIDFGITLWKYHINYTASPPPITVPTPQCPGGLTAALSRPTNFAPMTLAAGGRGGGGRGGRAGGGVGEPGKGAITLATAGQARGGGPALPGAPAQLPGAPGAVPGSAAAAAGVVPGGLPGGARQGGPGGGGGGGGGSPFIPGNDAAYVVGSDGYLHALNIQNGWDNMTPALFLPANTRAQGLIIASAPGGSDAVAYAATTRGCGSQPDAIWAMDLASPQKTVVAFKAGGATIAGSAGPALGQDGTVYAATTDGSALLSSSLIALEPKTLKLKASTSVSKEGFSSSPLVFEWKGRDAVVVAGANQVFVFDSVSLQGGPIATASIGNGTYEKGALVSWLDAQSTRWIAVPSSQRIETFKVIEQEGKVSLQAGWTSRAIAAPLRPLVINGVLFALASGSPKAPAVLYAMEAATGKELWNSGKTITTSVSGRGALSGGQGNVYVPGADGVLYAFGFEIEK
ncbi:MAG: hypothetical protein HY654_04540 [Acidobacteria bacterium]|nr:hypothetical protein [Acidobacteriota bacterium]